MSCYLILQYLCSYSSILECHRRTCMRAHLAMHLFTVQLLYMLMLLMWCCFVLQLESQKFLASNSASDYMRKVSPAFCSTIAIHGHFAYSLWDTAVHAMYAHLDSIQLHNSLFKLRAIIFQRFQHKLPFNPSYRSSIVTFARCHSVAILHERYSPCTSHEL